MILAPNTNYLLLSAITVIRAERQRREIDTSDLDESIRANGVLQPIVVRTRRPSDGPGNHPEAPFVLVAGERRYTASAKAGLSRIPYVLLQDLPPAVARIVELEENVKRKELHWRDEVGAVGELHQLYLASNPTHSQAATAKLLSLHESSMTRYLRVFRDIGSPRITRAASLHEAYNVLKRMDERAIDDAVSDIMDASATIGEQAEERREPEPQAEGGPPVSMLELVEATQRPLSPSQLAPGAKSRIPASEDNILALDFREWAKEYVGPKFNLLHCDFPYGIDVFAGKQSGSGRWDTYDDAEGVYWGLLDSLAQHQDRLLAPSAHMFFWFSMEFYTETLEFFNKFLPDWTVQKFPLIWHKSDNVGVLPDPKRGPRRVYETALFASRGDRLILKPVSNFYACSTDKRYHQSTKPESMLRHFFQMTVDENTRLLDPTCGSGSALRAAESLGAKHVIGLENHPEHLDAARKALRSFRVLREASGNG